MDLEKILRDADSWKCLKRNKNKLPSKKAWRLLVKWHWFNVDKLHEFEDHLRTGKSYQQAFDTMGMGGQI